jgi:hypothetical protein
VVRGDRPQAESPRHYKARHPKKYF